MPELHGHWVGDHSQCPTYLATICERYDSEQVRRVPGRPRQAQGWAWSPPGGKAPGEVPSATTQRQQEAPVRTIEIDVHVDLQSDRGLLERIDRNTERMARQMATITDAIQGLADKLGGIEDDVKRVLAALENEELSPEAQQAVDALSARMDTLNTELDEAVPPQPAEGEPQPL